jgi:hypothetical protein
MEQPCRDRACVAGGQGLRTFRCWKDKHAAGPSVTNQGAAEKGTAADLLLRRVRLGAKCWTGRGALCQEGQQFEALRCCGLQSEAFVLSLQSSGLGLPMATWQSRPGSSGRSDPGDQEPRALSSPDISGEEEGITTKKGMRRVKQKSTLPLCHQP